MSERVIIENQSDLSLHDAIRHVLCVIQKSRAGHTCSAADDQEDSNTCSTSDHTPPEPPSNAPPRDTAKKHNGDS